MIDLKNVRLGDIVDVDMSDYPDFCDAHFETAWWKDTGVELTEDELFQLESEHPGLIGEYAFDYCVDAAESRYDAMCDR